MPSDTDLARPTAEEGGPGDGGADTVATALAVDPSLVEIWTPSEFEDELPLPDELLGPMAMDAEARDPSDPPIETETPET